MTKKNSGPPVTEPRITTYLGLDGVPDDCNGMFKPPPTVSSSAQPTYDVWHVYGSMVVKPERMPAVVVVSIENVVDQTRIREVRTAPLTPAQADELADLLRLAAHVCREADKRPYPSTAPVPPLVPPPPRCFVPRAPARVKGVSKACAASRGILPARRSTQ